MLNYSNLKYKVILLIFCVVLTIYYIFGFRGIQYSYITPPFSIHENIEPIIQHAEHIESTIQKTTTQQTKIQQSNIPTTNVQQTTIPSTNLQQKTIPLRNLQQPIMQQKNFKKKNDEPILRNPENGPKYPPTMGEVWPKPQNQKNLYEYYVFETLYFNFKVLNQTCDILISAVERYNLILSNLEKIKVENAVFFNEVSKTEIKKENVSINKRIITKLHILLSTKCEEYPHYDMDERYNLTIGSTSVLSSNSIWGILRGLETFSQLFYINKDYSEIRINTTEIIDYPQYKHRGLLVDTARHYLDVSTILKMLDAMEMNKMNVFHWHIVDDQSFPYQSERFPSLSLKGAYAPQMVYTRNNITSIIEYARVRGIRVIPEFDVPGHTGSWGNAFPDLLTKCYDKYNKNKPRSLGSLNPINEYTYEFLKLLYQELDQLFPDKFLHVGGDEVDKKCWESNPEIIEYMKKNNIMINQIHGLFVTRALSVLPNETRPIVWQEVFDNNAIKTPTHVQVWKYEWIPEMVKILKGGHYVIFSSTWYLDYLNDGWEKFYQFDPRQMVYQASHNEGLLSNIVGGEACMWAEKVDDTNVISRTWPRTSAVAERLWSGIDYKINTMHMKYPVGLHSARQRIEEHKCRMNRRGIPAEPPSGPGYCVGASY